MSKEVGSGQVAVFPVFKGFRRAVSTEMDGAAKEGSTRLERGFNKAGERAGGTTGRGFKKSFADASKGAGDAALKELTGDVAKASREVSGARLKEQDAAGKVRVAETQLAEARKKYTADSSQVVRAEERLATTQRTLQTAQDASKASTDKLAASQKNLAEASKQAETAAKQSGGVLRRAFSGIGSVVSSAASGIQSAFSSAMAGVRQVASDATEFVGSAFKAVAAIIATTMGAALVGGFGRLSAIENATARMKGLGFASEDVAAAMKIADNAAQGTAFGMDELAGAAAMAMTAGVKPGQGLVDYLEAIKGAATASGTSVDEVAKIFGKVRTGGRAYTAEINQLADRQIPIWSALADEIGVSAEEVRNLASEGKITAEVFEAAVRRSTGGMAAAMAETTGTAFTNMRAALKRFGVALMGSRMNAEGEIEGGIFPLFKTLFDMIRSGLDAVTAVITPTMQAWTDAFAGKVGPALERLTEKFNGIKDSFKEGLPELKLPAFGNISGLFSALAPLVGGILGSLGPLLAKLPLIGGAFAGLTGPVGLVIGAIVGLLEASPKLREALGGVFETLGTVVGDLMSSLGPVLSELAPILGEVATLVGDALGDALVTLTPILPVLGEAFGQILTALLPLVPALLELLPPILLLIDPLTQLIVALVPPLTSLLVMLAEVVTAILVPAIGFLVPILEGLISWISGGLEMITAFVGFISGEFSMQQMIDQVMGIQGPFGDAMRWVANLGTTIISFVQDAIANIISFVSGVQTNIGNAVGFLTSLPGRILGAIGNMGSLLFNSGKDLIQGFIDGIKNMVGAVGDAVGGVMDFVSGFFPHSPAKRGPFSGSGWTRVKQGGKALGNQFTDGITAATQTLQLGALSATVVSASAAAAQVAGGTGNDRPIYMDGRLFGWLREMANGEAQIVLADYDRSRSQQGVRGFVGGV